MSILTEQEQLVLKHLADAWNAFLQLERNHPDELNEFRHGIHAVQHIVLSRPAIKAVKVAA